MGDLVLFDAGEARQRERLDEIFSRLAGGDAALVQVPPGRVFEPDLQRAQLGDGDASQGKPIRLQDGDAFVRFRPVALRLASLREAIEDLSAFAFEIGAIQEDGVNLLSAFDANKGLAVVGNAGVGLDLQAVFQGQAVELACLHLRGCGRGGERGRQASQQNRRENRRSGRSWPWAMESG